MAAVRDTVNKIFLAIARGDVDGFVTMLGWLPLESCPVDMQDRYLAIMLKKSSIAMLTPAANPEMHRIIYQKWIQLNPTEDTVPIFPKIFSVCDIEDLRTFTESVEMEYYNAIVLLSFYFDESFIADVLGKYDAVYGLQTYETYKRVLEYLSPREHKEVKSANGTLEDITKTFMDPNYEANETQQQRADKLGEELLDEGGIITKTDFSVYLYEYTINKMKETAPIAGKPKWILPDISPTEIQMSKGIFEGYPDDPKNGMNSIMPTANEFADLMVENMRGMVQEESLTDMHSVLAECYRDSDGVNVKLMLILPIYTDLFIKPFDDDDELIRYYGPLNPFVSMSDLLTAPNARMLECTHFEHPGNEETAYYSGVSAYADPDPEGLYTFEDTTSWFTGNCDVCNLKIDALHHAVRMPRPAGGWYGCYCSWNCVLHNLPNAKTATENELNGRKIIAHLVRYFSGVLNRVGIYDRLPASDMVEPVDYSTAYEQAKSAYEEQKKRGFDVADEIPLPTFEF